MRYGNEKSSTIKNYLTMDLELTLNKRLNKTRKIVNLIYKDISLSELKDYLIYTDFLIRLNDQRDA